MERITEEEFYKEYNLNTDDKAIMDMAHVFYETMSRSLEEHCNPKEIFIDFSTTWRLFQDKTNRIQKQFRKVADDFQYMWKGLAQSFIDKFYLHLNLAENGSDEEYDKISEACIDIIEAIAISDDSLWEDTRKLFNKIGNFKIRKKAPQSFMALMCILAARLCQIGDHIEYHALDDQDFLYSLGLKHHSQAKAKEVLLNTEAYAKIIIDAFLDEMFIKIEKGSNRTDILELAKNANAYISKLKPRSVDKTKLSNYFLNGILERAIPV